MRVTLVDRPRPATPNRTRRGADRVFYPALAILISATCFVGFSFTYFRPVLSRTYPPAGFLLHLHGWSFFLWYLLFPLQAVLGGRRDATLHRAVGVSSPALVAVMTLTGILVLAVRVDEAVRNGAPEVWLRYGPLFLAILLLFVGFYAAAIYMAVARQFEAHKRLIIVASSIGLAAGFARVVMILTGFHPQSIPMGALGCSLFILIGMAYDRLTRGAVHGTYWIGLAALVLVEVAMLPQVNGGGVAWINEGLAVLGDRLGFLYEPHPTVEF